MDLQRRKFLGLAAFGTAVCCVNCLTLVRAFAASPAAKDAHAAPHWNYEGKTGPANWGELQPDFKICKLGLEQTPIDLASGIKADVGAPVTFDYRPLPLRILNNGHTIQVNADPGSSCVINGAKYDLLQFHFHHPSEHLLSGKSFDLECHFVHRSSAGDLAVVGVFIKPGNRNTALQPLFDAMPKAEGPEQRASGSIDAAALIPKSSGYFRYMGSLTTPPCSEGLTWTVFKDPIEASSEQIRQFAMLFTNNARPMQPLNRRFLLESN